ncbi:MAG: DUF362 domain-containing protein [Methanobacterium sp.]|nr:DUF362 domain-containing protein [Methanobacterium sp.]
MVFKKTDVYLIKTNHRTEGINSLLEKFNLDEFSGKNIALKANFNSADPFPASTHLETLEALVGNLQEAGAAKIVLAERSGMGNTSEVLKKLGVFQLSDKLDFEVVILDEEDKERWFKVEGRDNHWLRGFYISRIFLEADKVVQTCCLKTHRFGGHFTLSLKNSVGVVAKKLPGSIYNYMNELHLSPHQRKMIAEINQQYPVDLILMDGMNAFVNKGPERGDIIEPNLLIASKDRVAIDVVGVALLRYYGTTSKVSSGSIFKQEQIRRAAEIGVGVESAEQINLIPLDEASQEITADINSILEEQG